MSRLFIIPCTGKKQRVACPVRSLYQGPYFRWTLQWCLTVAKQSEVLVASALYGLLPLDTVVAPYDCRLVERAIPAWAELVASQAVAYELQDYQPYILCPDVYAQGLQCVWPDSTIPLAGLGGLFGVQKTLAANAGRLPEQWVQRYRTTSKGTRALP
jgi:hypothetical protein